VEHPLVDPEIGEGKLRLVIVFSHRYSNLVAPARLS